MTSMPYFGNILVKISPNNNKMDILRIYTEMAMCFLDGRSDRIQPRQRSSYKYKFLYRNIVKNRQNA